MAGSQTTRVTAYESGKYERVLNSTHTNAYAYYGWVVNQLAGADTILNFAELELHGQELLPTYSTTSNASSCSFCTICPAGQLTSTACTTTGDAACAPCAAGTYGTALNLTQCTQCGVGTYSTVLGAFSPVTCIICEPGSYNPIVGKSTQGCIPCSSSFYGTGYGFSSNSQCLYCQAGTYSTGFGLTAAEQCTLCNAGTYSTALRNRVPCPLCVSGTYSSVLGAISSAHCTLCSTGTYSTAAGATENTTCSWCSSGTYSSALGAVANTACATCDAGKYCNTPSTQTTCSAGYFCPASSTAQTLCSSENYCPVGSSSQTPCLAGYFCPTPSSQNVCPANQYCLQGVTAPTNCSVCTNGQYIASVCSSTADTVCPACAAIPVNAAYTGVGSSASNCPWICNSGYFLDNGQCAACPVGSWCAANVQNTCPTNANSTSLSLSQNQCLCKPGYAGDGSISGTSPCPICQAGSYCPGGNGNTSIACPANFSSPVGSSSYDSCQCVPGYLRVGEVCELCGPGQICLSGQLSTCPANSLAPAGSSASSDCVCNPGFFGQNGSPCTECPANSFCPGGNAIAACTADAVSPVQSTNATACYCDRGYQGVANAPCSPCPEDTWCWTGVLNACPEHTSSPALSSWWLNCTCDAGYTGSDGSACSPCVAGTYKADGGSAACSECSADGYCPIASVSPTPCPFDNSNSPAGSLSADQCVCDAGYFGAQCNLCTVGYVCPGGSDASITRCPNDGYTVAGALNVSGCLCPVNSAPVSDLCACSKVTYSANGVHTDCLLSDAALDSAKAWCFSDPIQTPGTMHLTMDVGAVGRIANVSTRGRYETPTHGQYVTKYELQYSLDGVAWTSFGTLNGNTDTNSVVTHPLNIRARYLRFFPLTWVVWPSMRIGFTPGGCPTNPTTPLPRCLAEGLPVKPCTCSLGYERIVDAASPAGWRCDPCGVDRYCEDGVSTACPALSTAPSFSNSSAACQCGDGYYMSSGVCVMCGYGAYSKKGAVGSCAACPANSNTSAAGSSNATMCFCQAGYEGGVHENNLQPRNVDAMRQCGSYRNETCKYSILSGDINEPLYSVDNLFSATSCSGLIAKQSMNILFRIELAEVYSSLDISFIIGQLVSCAYNPAWLPRTHKVTISLGTTLSNAVACYSYTYTIGDSGMFKANSCAGIPARYITFFGEKAVSDFFFSMGKMFIVGQVGPCLRCSSNYYCPGNQANYTLACPNSQYSLLGSSSVSQCGCPAASSLLPDLNCTCNNGTFNVLNATAPLGGWQCNACPATKFCQLGTATNCPAGYTCPANTINPVICPQASYCLASSATPTLCPGETYSLDVGASSLSQCICPVNASIISGKCMCDAGFERMTNGSVWTCALCRADQYCVSGVSYSCPSLSTSPIGTGAYAGCQCSAPRMLSVRDKIYGFSGDLGTHASLGVGPKVFIIRNHIFPKLSPLVGTTIVSWTVTTTKACTIQPFYTGAGSDAFFSNPASGEQIYYIVGMAEPVSIPIPGTYTFPWKVAALRGGNSLSSANSISIGWYDSSGSGSCIATNLTASDQLTTGFAPLNPLWMDGYLGKYGNGFYGRVALQINRAPVSNTPSDLSCLRCNQDTYYNGTNMCGPCPSNSYTPPGAASVNDCTCGNSWFKNWTSNSTDWRCSACVAGNYCLNETQISCPRGSYCPASSSAPVPCPAGTYAPDTGTSSLAGCLPCGFGFFSVSAGSTVCTACQVNSNTTVANANSTSQCQCYAGYFASGGVCVACGFGTYSGVGAVGACTACPALTNTSNRESSALAQCMCTAGYSGDVLALSPACNACHANSYCPGGQVNHTVVCPNSQFSLPGAGSVSQCVCPANAKPTLSGCQCDNGFNRETNAMALLAGWECAPCAAGSVCINGTTAPCAAGFSCAGGMSSLCPVGSFCAAGASAPTPCNASGAYCPSGSTAPALCPLGFFCPTPVSVPTPCTAGGFCPRGSSAPTQCPVGTYSTKTQQSSLATCIRCTTCPLGAWETTQCSSTQNRVCTMCTEKPERASYLTASAACSWVCDGGYFGSQCSPCLAGFWCKAGVANRCPMYSGSPAVSFEQNACVCFPGYFSQKTELGTSLGSILGSTPCAACRAGSVCPGSGIIPAQIQSEPIENVNTQFVLAKTTMPGTPNLVTLFESIPASIAAVRAALPLSQRSVTIFTRKICRDTYCAMCDGSEQCIPRFTVGVSRGKNGKYAFNVTNLRADMLYLFVAITPGMCAPTIGIDPEYVTSNRVAIASISTLRSAPIECLTDTLINTPLPVTGTAAVSSRRLLESAKRRMLQQSTVSSSLALSFVVPTNETTEMQNSIADTGVTIEGYAAIESATLNMTSSPLTCPENATSPEGSTSIDQCVCKPGYKGDAAAGTPCSPCPPDTFCSGGLLGLCSTNALAPPMSSLASDCACMPGFYGDRLACKQCPVNHFCRGGLNATKCTANALSPVQSTSGDACNCDIGYAGTRNTPCVLCPVGSWCWTGIENTCPVDSITTSGASSASDCSCVDGFRSQLSTDVHGVVTRNCLRCSGDTYCKGGVLNQCPQFSTSPEESSLITQCQCQANSYLDNGACMCTNGYVRGRPGFEDQCTLCPAGYWCPEQNTVRVCTDDALSPAGSFRAENCTLCAEGWFKNGPLSCRRCRLGYVCPTPATETVCVAGAYAPALATACVTCAANSYSSVNASTSCTPCAAGAMSEAGATRESQCICGDGYYKLGLTRTCGLCPAGSACSNNLIAQCPLGETSAPGQPACSDCAQGTYQPTVGGSVCMSCPAGPTVDIITSQTELNAPIERQFVKTSTGKVYIMRTFLESTIGRNLTKWSIYANAPGCIVTPLMFSSVDATPELRPEDQPTFMLEATGATRTVSAAGAHTFSFYSDPAQGFLVSTYVYFGWTFEGAACIPYDKPELPVGQAPIPVMEFDFTGGIAYQFTDSVYGENERWSVQIGNEFLQTLPSTIGAGSGSVADCRCPSSAKKLASGICQPLCPNGMYMAEDTHLFCSPCKQGSYCVESSILPCGAGFSSLAGASVCTPCVVAGNATDIALYTCGLKTCTKANPQPLGASGWRGLGKLDVGVNRFGSLDDFPFTPWAPGSVVVGMVLNPASDRPYALLERDISVVPDKPNALQFRYKCAGAACVRSFVVQYREFGGQFVDIFSADSIPTVNWVQTSTEFFTPASMFVTVRFVAELHASSSKVWLSGVETVGMGLWTRVGGSEVRLLNTTTVPISYSANYTEQEEVSTLRLLAGTSLMYDVPSTTVYPGRTFPGSIIYIVSVFARGTGTLLFDVVDELGALVDADHQKSWVIVSDVFGKYIFQLKRAPTKVTITSSVGTLVVASPSLTLRDEMVGCQQCLAGYHCSGQTINVCPSNSMSVGGSDEQSDCHCVEGFYGNVNYTVGWSPCSPCPANHFCDGSKAGNHLQFCPNGTKSNLSSWVCSSCQVDEYCAFGHVGACPDFSTSPISSWDVTHCVCDPGYYGTAPDCKPCEPGFYCTGGNRTSCTAHATSTPKSDDPTDCFCNRGYYGIQNTPCRPCEEGSWCWDGIKNSCPLNMWSPIVSSYQTNCTCTDGSYPSGASCVLCSSGTYKAGKGKVGCISCPAGTSSMAIGATNVSTCAPCEPGTYSVVPGQYQCQECVAGYYQPSRSSTSCAECWAGSYSLGKSAVCTSCFAGTESAVVAASSFSTCKMCDAGWWSPGNVSKCTMCGVCSFWRFPATVVFQPLTLNAVLTQNTQKFQFAPNSVDGRMFMGMGTSIYFVDLTTGLFGAPLNIQFPGRNWWFASLSGSKLGDYLYGVQDRVAFRVDLNMGSWDKTYGAVLPSCIVEDTSRPAPVVWIGQISGVLAKDPIQEDKVIYSYPMEGTNYVCLSPTDSDFLYVTGTFGLRKVAKSTGSYTVLLTGTPYTVCQVTPDGLFVILSQNTGKTVWSYSLFDATMLKVASNALVSGMYVDGQNLVLGVDAVGVRNISYSTADSRTCSPGKVSFSFGGTSEAQCDVCPTGNLCPGGSNQTACVPGTYSFAPGLRQQEQCLNCPAGYFCPGANVRTMCPLGSFSPATKLVMVSECPLCAENYYCPNTTAQLKCPANTVSLPGAHDLSECTCTPGYRCIIAKVVHAEIVLQMTEAQFTDIVRAKYIAAIALAPGVDISKVTIVSVQQVSLAGSLRRLLGLGTQALEVHTSIYEAPTESLSDLNGHLMRQGLPSYHDVRIFVQNEVVDSVRLGR